MSSIIYSMELNVLENKPGKLKIEVIGETHTLLNLVTEYAWLAKAKQASYTIKHPYLSNPELTVFSANPKRTLTDASQLIINQTKECEKLFKFKGK